MKFKSNTFAYYGVTFMHLFILALWIVLLIFIPIRNKDDLDGFAFSLIAAELLIFSCSPIAHRIVIVDDKYISEKWLFLKFNQIEISDIGVCTYLSGNQVRQFVFLSTCRMSDEEVIAYDQTRIFQRRKLNGRFLSIEHPQKGLDDCINQIAETNSLSCRKFSA